MSTWKATKSRRVLAALLRNGWSIKRTTGSHRILERTGFPNFVFAFYDNEEIGPRMLAWHVLPKTLGFLLMMYHAMFTSLKMIFPVLDKSSTTQVS